MNDARNAHPVDWSENRVVHMPSDEELLTLLHSLPDVDLADLLPIEGES